VITGADIAPLAPFTAIFEKTEPEELDLERFTSCYYVFKYDRDLGYPKAGIDINEYETVKESQDDFKMRKSDWKNLTGRDPDNISGLCDQAAFWGETEQQTCGGCGLTASCGRYVIKIHFYAVGEVGKAKFRDSAVSVANLLFQKKPFLRGKK
jgi:hypothetical protein